jgi:hypothetical protein
MSSSQTENATINAPSTPAAAAAATCLQLQAVTNFD